MSNSDVAETIGSGPDVWTARASRLDRVREQMTSMGVEALLLSIGADMPWLTGYEAMPLERPTVLVVPVDDVPTLVVPLLEAPRVDHNGRLFNLRAWGETEDAVDIVSSIVGHRRHLAISDRAFAGLLIALDAALPGAKWQQSSVVTACLRAVKDQSEIAALKAAGEAADVVARALVDGEIRLVGRTELDVSRELTRRLLDAGHNRVGFSIVASGPNAASPHHEPGERVIANGEAVVCDFGGVFKPEGDIGYCSDITRTVVAGEPVAALVEIYEIYEILQAAHAAGVAAAVLGATCQAVDRAAREVIASAGFGRWFVHRTGHGIGIEEHEDPYIVEGNATEFVQGHAFSIEPGIYLPGRTGARIEDVAIIDGLKAHLVTSAGRNLVPVGA